MKFLAWPLVGLILGACLTANAEVQGARRARGGVPDSKRTFYKEAAHRPAVLKLELNADDSEELYNAFGNERVVISAEETRNGKKGYRLLFGAELLPKKVTGLADPKDNQKLFVTDSEGGRPSLIMQLDFDPQTHRYSSSIWFWIWADNPAPGDKASHHYKVMKSPSSGKDVLRFELISPGEAFALYDRLAFPVEPGENPNFNPPIPANVKPFVSSDDGAFTFACYEYREGGQLRSVNCSFETELAGAKTIAAGGNQEALITRAYRSHTALVAHHQQVKANALAYVNNQIQMQKVAKVQADKDLIDKAYGAYIRSRPIPAIPQGRTGPGREFFEAMGADNLRVLIQGAQDALYP